MVHGISSPAVSHSGTLCAACDAAYTYHGSGFVGNQKRKSKDQAAADGKTNKDKAIAQQIELLTLKKEHIENLISLAREIRSKGAGTMSFDAFDMTHYIFLFEAL